MSNTEELQKINSIEHELYRALTRIHEMRTLLVFDVVPSVSKEADIVRMRLNKALSLIDEIRGHNKVTDDQEWDAVDFNN